MVKVVLSQSQDAPNFFNCSRIIPPCLLVHSQACSKNLSLDKSLFLIPSDLNFWTTLASVAIDA